MTVRTLHTLGPATSPKCAEPHSAVRLLDGAVALGGRQIWEGISLDLAPGEIVAVLGPNGAGKSILLKVLLGFIPLTRGSVTVFGQPPREVRGQVGYIPQRRQFGHETRIRGRDLIRLGLDGDRWGLPLPFLRAPGTDSPRKRVDEAIHLAGAESIDARPLGELSGGEQKRVMMAEALVRKPRLLLLDEPLESLDLARRQEIAALIQSVRNESGAAFVVVAHDVNPLLPYVDRICYLARGQGAVGKPDEVITSAALSRLYGAEVEVFRTRNGQVVVAGAPEAIGGCLEHPDR